MSNVNADATQLLTILKNMRTSISSIETTRSSVKMKYQQLGIGWNDKKYDELGTIVKDCNKALNDILQIMLQAEKYVASLAKSVQEYDNVNLDTPSARNSFLQGLQTPNVGNSSYQYCLGVLTQGSTPDGYIAVISQRHENAEQNVREVFDHFAGKLMIQDSEYPPDQTAHYSPGNYIGHSRGVYYNAASDMTNPRGADNIITLNDENGNEVEFEFLDLIPYRQNEYVVLLPIGDSDGQVVILQLKEIDDETEEYVGVENEFVLETVFALFKERNKDFFTFE